MSNNNPSGRSNWKTWGFFWLFFLISHTQLMMTYSFQALLYAISHNLPSPGLLPQASEWPASSQLSTPMPRYSQVQNWLHRFLLENRQWHLSTYTRLLYLHPFHDLEPRTHVSTLILVPNTMIEPLPSFPNSSPGNCGLISLFNLQAPKDIHH